MFEDADNAALYRRFAVDGTGGLIDIGAPVTATDENGDTLVYSLAGNDVEFFDINPDTGQLRISSGSYELYYTDESSYTFHVEARDGNGGTARVAVTVYVVYPLDRPRVSRAGSTSLSVTWTAPSGAGTAITEYELRYRRQGTSAWTEGDSSYTATSATLSGLREATGYEAQIRAYHDDDGVFGPWSESGVGNTGNAASGRPDILGVTEAGERLTANRDAVTDPDGTTKANDGESGYAYAYQWIRVGTDASETDIADATGSTYSLTGSDVGTRIKVSVSFTDDADNPETVTSEAVGPVASARGSCDPRHIRDGDIDWCTELTVGTTTEEADMGETIAVYGYRGSSPRYGLLMNDIIQYNAKTYTVKRLTLEVGESTRTLTLDLSGGRMPSGSTVQVGETIFTVDGALVTATGYRWNAPSDLVWVAGGVVVVSVGLENFSASGRPGIKGLARVGETLTATTSDIVDPDGKSRAEAGERGFAYSYQWARNDGNTKTDIAGATARTYTLTDADLGKKVSVSVVFRDDADDENDSINGPMFSHAFPMRFAGIGAHDPGGAPTITGATLVGDALTANLGTIADADGLPTTTFPDGYTFQWVRVDGTLETDIPGATSATYTLTDRDRGMRIKVMVSFTDGGGNAEGPRESAATDEVAERTATSCLANSDWCTTMTVGVHPLDTSFNLLGYLRGLGSAFGGFDSGDTIGIGRRFQRILTLEYDADAEQLFIRSDHEIPYNSVLKVGEHQFTATSIVETDRQNAGEREGYVWNAEFDWSPGHRVMVSLKFGNFVPVLENATVNGTTLVLTWYEDLDPNSVPAASAFEIDADGTEKAVSSVSVAGNTVTLTLATPVTSSQTVTLDYEVPSSNPLQDLEGLDAADLENEKVTNYTGLVVPVTIDSQYESIGGGLEALVFTLEREGLTSESLEVTVTLTQVEVWLADADLEHTVTFAVGESAKTLIIPAEDFSLDPVASGDLTATVTGTDVSGGSDTVEVVSTSGPPLTIRIDPESTLAENDADAAVYAVATLDPAYPRTPTSLQQMIFSSVGDTATSPSDFAEVQFQMGFVGSDFEPDADQLVARKAIPVALVNDMVYEGTEHFTMTLEPTSDTRTGFAQAERSDGSTCELGSCSPAPRYSVFITDEGDRELPVLSLTSDKMSIDEEDNSSTTDITENVATLTVAITNGKTYDTDQTITLTFEGNATYGTHYGVTPADTNTIDPGHQVDLGAGTSSVALTITAAGNTSDDSNRSIVVTGALGGTAFARTFITILDNESTDSNTSATGKPTIEGTVEGDPIVGRSLTVDLDNIEDADGLVGVSDYFYQWVRVDTMTAETPLSVSPIYTPVLADVGSTIKVQVSFIDDGHHPEGPLESDAVGPVLATFNAHPAEGQPSIEGVVQVGKELTAGAGNMADGDSLPDTTFPDGYTFQWVSVDDMDAETDIGGATAQTYAPTAADVGNRLKVEVTFTDGGDTVETLASDVTVAVVRAAEDCATDRPDNDWCTTMTVGERAGATGTNYGFRDTLYGSLDDTTISDGATTWQAEGIWIWDPNTGTDKVEIDFDTGRVPHGSVFDFGGTPFTAEAASEHGSNVNRYSWDAPAGFAWLNGQEVTVSVNLPPAVVSAALDGTTLVLTYGEDLDTGSVPAASAFVVDVVGADNPTVSGVAVDGNTVTLTLATAVASTATEVTLDYTVPTSNPLQDLSGLDALALVGLEVDIDAARGQPTITGTPQVGMALTAGPGDIADPDGLPGTFPDDYTFQWVRVGTGDNETDIGSNSPTYTPVAADVGNTIRVEVSFTDGANNLEGPLASDATATVVRAPQDCATDRPHNDWCTTLTVEEVDIEGSSETRFGYNGVSVPNLGRLDNPDIVYGPSFTVQRIMADGVAGSQHSLQIGLRGLLPLGTVFDLGGTTFTTDDVDVTDYVWLSAGLAWIDGQKVTVSANLAPLQERAAVVGTTLTLTYAEDLDPNSVPAANAFEVDVNGADGPAVTGVGVSGNTVTLTLATAITVLPNIDVRLDYTPPSSDPLQDLSGLDAPAFSNQAVATDPRGAVLTPAALAVNEGATEPYTVELTEAPTGRVTVRVSGAGVALSTASLAFTPTTWNIPQTVEVTAGEDDNAVDEEVTVTHTPSGGGYDGATLPDLVVTVVDNDGGIVADPLELTVAEGANDHYGLTLTRRPTSDVTVKVTGGAGDVIATPSTLTFTADDWETEQFVEVSGKRDTDKNDESVTLRHTATGGGYSVEADDDALAAPVKVTVEDADATAPGAPGLTATGANESVRLAWSPPGDNGGAPVTGYQYRRGGGAAVEVPGGAEARSATVPGLVNGTEYSFELRALNRVGEGDWSTAQTATPIPLTLTVEAVREEVTEGEPVRYRIVMSECAGWVSVNLVYRHEGEFMRFAPSSSGQGIRCERGELAWEVERGTVDDDDIEADGSFTVALAPGDGYGLGTPSQATVRILDNDGGAAPGPTPGLAVSVVSPTMLDAAWRAAPARGAPLTGYTVEYREAGTGPWTHREIAPDARAVRLAGLSPATAYQVRVRAENVRGAGPWSSVVQARTAPDPRVTLSIERGHRTLKVEGVTLKFTVRAQPAPASALRVDLRVTETLEMLAGGAPTSVTVPAGQRSAAFEVRTRNDAEDEGDSEVTAELLPSVRYLLGEARSAMYRVYDDEADTDRGRVGRPRVERIEDPRTPEHVQAELRAHGEEPLRVLRFAWDAPSDIALAHVRGWQVEWDEVMSCEEPAPGPGEAWSGGSFWLVSELEGTAVLRRPRAAAHFRVRTSPVGARFGPWSAPVCGDMGDLESAQGGASEPVVTGVRIGAAQGEDGAWREGDALEAVVRFSEAVTVDTSGGTPTLAVVLGDARREAVYAGGSGTQALAFVHEVGPDDDGARGARVVAGGLALNGATIQSSTGIDAELGFALAPVVTSVAVEADPDRDGLWSPGESVTVTLGFSDAVTVRTEEGTPSVTLLAGGVREAVYAGGSETVALRFAWEVGTADDAVPAVLVPENALKLNGGVIEGPTGLAAVLAHVGAGHSGTPRVVDETPALSVADASAVEGTALEFAVTLDRASLAPAAVDWETRDGSARAGEDYEAGSGTLHFAPGETAKTIRVAVLDDVHDEGREVMLVVLSNPVAATIAKAWAGGVIENDDLMPQAWLARFGRTVAEQVLDAVETRIRSAPPAGVRMTVAGQAIGAAGAPDAEALEEAEAKARLDGLSAWLAGETETREQRAGARSVTPRELLAGSSFALTTQADGIGGGLVSLWGRGAVSRFDGREDEFSLSGEVTGALLGADWTRERSTLGFMLSHVRGEGGYRGADSGEVTSTLTGFYPYGRYLLGDRVTVWGAAGYGVGTLTLTPENDDGTPRAAIRTDMDLMMAAVGLRGVLVKAPDDGGPELAVKTDALGVRTASEAVRGSGDTGGNLAPAQGDVTRLRLGLEGTWRGLAVGTGTLEPRLEVGVRHEDGDAETGYGLDLGGGLAWSDPATGIEAGVSGRGLLTHEAGGFRDLGIAGSFGWDPAPGSDRGPSLSLTQTMGLSATGGADALLGRRTLEGLAANDDGDELDRRRLELTLGYGFAAFGDRFTSTPEVGLGWSESVRETVLGWRLEGAPGTAFEVRFEGARLQAVNDDDDPEHRLGLRMTARF